MGASQQLVDTGESMLGAAIGLLAGDNDDDCRDVPASALQRGLTKPDTQNSNTPSHHCTQTHTHTSHQKKLCQAKMGKCGAADVAAHSVPLSVANIIFSAKIFIEFGRVLFLFLFFKVHCYLSGLNYCPACADGDQILDTL